MSFTSEITKCRGEFCRKREECLRYVQADAPYGQEYFRHTPLEHKFDDYCAYFVEDPVSKARKQDKSKGRKPPQRDE